MPTVASRVGKKIKKAGGDRDERRTERRERREERRENRRAMGTNRGAYTEDFAIESDSDWLWGTFFLVVLLFILSPGVLLTLPPGRGGLFMSGNTSMLAALVHAVLIALIFNYM